MSGSTVRIPEPRLAAPPTPSSEALAPADSLTPTPRQWWQRTKSWVYIAVALIAVAVIGLLAGGAMRSNSTLPLDPDSPAPAGGMGLVNTLANHGVALEVTHSLDETRTALGDPAASTLVVFDRNGVLTDEQWTQVRELGVGHLIVIPASQGARTAVHDVAMIEGSLPDPADEQHFAGGTFAAGADCPAPLPANAPAITNLGGTEYVPVDGAHGCWQARDGYIVVTGEVDGTAVTVIGATTFLDNDHLLADANAAAGINLFGAEPNLVWYEPGYDDYLGTTPTIGDYVPQWLTPAMLLLGLAGLAATVWRGRRFGPLVSERLPVAVPASETLEGRARLYDNSDARLRALDSLRVGTVSRLAELVGLGRDADAAAIVTAAAPLAQVSREHAAHVLLTGTPTTDNELVDLANANAELERRVRAATGRATARATTAAPPPRAEARPAPHPVDPETRNES